MKAKSRLSRCLDDKIRGYLDEYFDRYLEAPAGVLEAYEYVQGRDSLLNRTKKQVLEMSIKRVLEEKGGEITGKNHRKSHGDVEKDHSIEKEAFFRENLSGIKAKKESESVLNSEGDVVYQKELLKSGNSSLNNEEIMKDQFYGISESKRRNKTEKSDIPNKRSKVNGNYNPPKGIMFDDLGGIDECINEILEYIVMPLMHPEVYSYIGIQIPRGVLLHGPSGCGKTLLANAIASEIGLPFISISAPSIVSGMSGESEKKIRDMFNEAKSIAPCLIFIDEIDVVTPKRENAQREMERRIVAQLLTCMDDLSLDKTGGKPVLIIGATNRPDSLDPALRRAGRFDHEICLNVPSEIGREKILRTLLKKVRLSGDFDYKKLAKMTPGYVGADLSSLVTTSGIVAIKRIFRLLQNNTSSNEKTLTQSNMNSSNSSDKNNNHAFNMDLNSFVSDNFQNTAIIQRFLKTYPDTLPDDVLSLMCITIDDFLEAIPKIQPSSKREGFATVPDVTWADVGALKSIRMEMQMAIVQPIKHPELYERVGITAPSGVLLWGPPGCGKTLLAKAVANESRANFISVRGPELLNKYVGESERAVRQVFSRARASVPCIIFFDELDAIVPRRDDSLPESSARVVNTLLTELDGLNDRRGIYVIAATNRPDIIDPAMMRPGRLDKPLFVELPSEDERYEILKTLTKKTPISSSVDLLQIAKDQRCQNFSGADLAALVREAAVLALRNTFFMDLFTEKILQNDFHHIPLYIEQYHFDKAFLTIRPSVSDKDRDRYYNLNRRYGCLATESS
ncbi:hypothetical protein T552_02726 [Pneumocystis carinii B80]|uniref:AAA+ ATPase domain-containing protein n=1 Tax=Pneumocystis carinii (strain B80) TaxID=1408658 RepID=A0A0W4ZEB4_PNEC8|nr:hypothetical protein T552_02726 [Pneumocystis carinii B80]KTW26720.1 hypothetical protein T552_02726 [Pneumocystis carinii B80]